MKAQNGESYKCIKFHKSNNSVVNNVGSTRIKETVVTTSYYMNIKLSNHYSKSINRKLFHQILKLEFVSTYNYEARRGQWLTQIMRYSPRGTCLSVRSLLAQTIREYSAKVEWRRFYFCKGGQTHTSSTSLLYPSYSPLAITKLGFCALGATG